MNKQKMGQRKILLIKAYDYVLPFGKHKGHTVEWILEHNPGYLVWLDNEKIAKVSDDIYSKAEEYASEEESDYYGGYGFPTLDDLIGDDD